MNLEVERRPDKRSLQTHDQFCCFVGDFLSGRCFHRELFVENDPIESAPPFHKLYMSIKFFVPYTLINTYLLLNLPITRQACTPEMSQIH